MRKSQKNSEQRYGSFGLKKITKKWDRKVGTDTSKDISGKSRGKQNVEHDTLYGGGQENPYSWRMPEIRLSEKDRISSCFIKHG